MFPCDLYIGHGLLHIIYAFRVQSHNLYKFLSFYFELILFQSDFTYIYFNDFLSIPLAIVVFLLSSKSSTTACGGYYPHHDTPFFHSSHQYFGDKNNTSCMNVHISRKTIHKNPYMWQFFPFYQIIVIVSILK